ncbi:hypothetical protein F5Y09DRAFT_333258 [Xylaria sp. FL1042]|nr:hypothetical protein F5Y09DRAFT_333258 [Xylaria sp. FL1042]
MPRLNAYLLSSFPEDQLESLKRAFEFGTCAPFHTMLELITQRAPASYEGKNHEHMLREDNAAGRKEPFGAVWYVDRFADQYDIEREQAVSTDVLWHILVKTEGLELMFVNYDNYNLNIQEELWHLGVELPAKEGYEIARANYSGVDMEDLRRMVADSEIIALPGEFEETEDKDIREQFGPMPQKAVRLKENVAKDRGGPPRTLPDEREEEYPKGSVRLVLKYDPNYNWPQYQWPEESL